MLLNKDILFVHIPKTAGTSIRDILRQVLPKPVLCAEMSFKDIGIGFADKHINLTQCFEVARFFGYFNFQKIIAVFRNPYTMEVSLYNHLCREYKNGLRLPSAIAAHNSQSFEDYILNSNTHYEWGSYQQYVTDKNGIVPNNLVIIKMEEDLGQALSKVLREVNISWDGVLPQLNSHPEEINCSEMYTSELKEVIYNKHQWVFDNKYYEK